MFPVLRSSLTPAPFMASPINRLASLFDRVFGDDGGFLSQAWPTLPLAMWEDDDHIYIEADVPGVSENDVEVTFQNGMLFIRGERRPQEGRRYLYNGQSFGRFERVVSCLRPSTRRRWRPRSRMACSASLCPRARRPGRRRSR